MYAKMVEECASSAKRPRTVNEAGAMKFHGLARDLQQALTMKQRFDVYRRLFHLIQYNPSNRTCSTGPQLLSNLVETGLVDCLCLQLRFLLRRHGICREDIELTCTAVEVFFKYCPALTTEDSLRRSGTELVQLLSDVSAREVILPMLSIWHSISTSSYGTILLLESSSFLYAIEYALRSRLGGKDGVMEVLGLLKNVTYYGEDFRNSILEHEGLVAAVTALPETDLCEKSQERLSAVIRNLALSPGTRLLLAQRSDVLNAITRLTNQFLRQTVRNLLSTLVSLSMDAESSLLIVFHGDGIIIELLKKFIKYDGDAVVRKRAARAIRLMARETSAPLLIHDDILMEMLSNRALHDTCSDVRVEAAEAFTRCAGLVRAPMKQHEAILDGLTHLASSPFVSADVVARALKEQSTHQENRKPMVDRCDFLTALANIALCEEASRVAKENACAAFFNLSLEEDNRVEIATSRTLDALVANCIDRHDRHGTIRELAVGTLLNLASNQINRKRMASHSNLLQGLLSCASSTNSDELKKKLKGTLVDLATEL